VLPAPVQRDEVRDDARVGISARSTLALARVEAWAATGDDHRKKRPRASLLNEEPHFLLDGSRTYSLRKHPIPPRATG
jgi:hypothetical protein